MRGQRPRGWPHLGRVQVAGPQNDGLPRRVPGRTPAESDTPGDTYPMGWRHFVDVSIVVPVDLPDIEQRRPTPRGRRCGPPPASTT